MGLAEDPSSRFNVISRPGLEPSDNHSSEEEPKARDLEGTMAVEPPVDTQELVFAQNPLVLCKKSSEGQEENPSSDHEGSVKDHDCILIHCGECRA